MRKLVVVLAIIPFLLGSASKFKIVDKIEFNNEKDFIVISGEFNEQMENKFNKEVMLKEKEDLTVFIDSPGGSVISVLGMISTLKSSGKNFTCVARFAASAAFMFLQFCQTRLVLEDNGVLMSHNGYIAIADEIPRIKSLLKMYERMMDRTELEIATRMNMTLKQYKREITDNLWMDSDMAKEYSAVDGIVKYATCSEKLARKKIIEKSTQCSFFGCMETKVRKSACPLITTTEEVKDEK